MPHILSKIKSALFIRTFKIIYSKAMIFKIKQFKEYMPEIVKKKKKKVVLNKRF